MCIIRIFGYRFLIAIKHDDRILLLRHSVHATCATTFIQCVCIVDKRRRARARTLVRAYTMNSRHTYSKLMHFYCGIFAFLLALISIHQRHKVIGGYIHNHKCNYYYLLLITKYIVWTIFSVVRSADTRCAFALTAVQKFKCSHFLSVFCFSNLFPSSMLRSRVNSHFSLLNCNDSNQGVTMAPNMRALWIGSCINQLRCVCFVSVWKVHSLVLFDACIQFRHLPNFNHPKFFY